MRASMGVVGNDLPRLHAAITQLLGTALAHNCREQVRRHLRRPFFLWRLSRYAGRLGALRGVTRMARNFNFASSVPITERILAIRERWHTKRHPFFLAFGEGKLTAEGLGRYQALHYHFVSRRWRALGCSMRALSFRRRAQDDCREHRRGGRAQGDPGARP